jgi:starch synthase
VIHAHDWQSAPACWGNRNGAGCVFTIHNLNYGADLIARAMAACDVATTVSPTYAREVRPRAHAPPVRPAL